jgi:hypothetical protein
MQHAPISRARYMQENRKMRFQEAFDGWNQGRLTQGAAAMRHLIEGADVFVHNLRPASIARLGLDYESVSAINPRIIWCGVYGYREDGP